MTSYFLIGPMGSGKTSVGRQLAKRLNYEFYDSDREIEARCGVDIPTIFEYEGEEGFRDRESSILDELTAKPGIVLATGGGSILREQNQIYLKERGITILLSVELKEQLRRISLNSNRPLLKVDDPASTLAAIMEVRAPIYKAMADIEISTNSSRMQNVLNRIMKQIEKRASLSGETNSNPLTETQGQESPSQ
ncbi:MAG: shikimate kinase [Granulosicoccus sp.]|nr:shikimate kinase [Granulosicoccus sp.]